MGREITVSRSGSPSISSERKPWHKRKSVIVRKDPNNVPEKAADQKTVAPAPSLAARRRSSRLPGWMELSGGEIKDPGRKKRNRFQPLSTLKLVLLILLVAAAFTLYVNHVNATREELARLQRLQRENLRLHLQYNRLKGDFDRETGPATIYERARELGLEEGLEYGPAITVRTK